MKEILGIFTISIYFLNGFSQTGPGGVGTIDGTFKPGILD